MGTLFGTDGVRGIANGNLSPELVFRLGRAAAGLLPRGEGRPRFLIGKDTRLSGGALEAALAAGIASTGVDAASLGVVTTPAVAYLVRRFAAMGGAMISASHNPAEYNGIKFFSPGGFKIPDEAEDEIEAAVCAGADGLPRPTGRGLGRITFDSGKTDHYIEYVASTVPEGLQGLSVVMDCAHGAAFRLAPALFRSLGARVAVINDAPDGLNINAGCGSLHPEDLCAVVRRERADAGLAFDGDADRVIAVDEKGQVVDGDQILAVAGLHLAARDRLPGRTVVATVMTNMGLEQALREKDIRLVRTRVGDRYVLEAMREGGYTLGGEQSGHVIFLEHATTGDGLLTGAQLLNIVRAAGRPLSELAAVFTKYPQVLMNVDVSNSERLSDQLAVNERIQQALSGAERVLEGRGRVLVRPSGTEPLVRVMVEGENTEQVRALAADLAGVIKQEIGQDG